MWRNIIGVVFPKTLSGMVTRILGSASIYSILCKSFDVGIGPTFSILILYYHKLLNLFVGSWADPVALAMLVFAKSIIGIDISLQPYWKQVFVVMCIYFVRNGLRITSDSRLFVTGSVLTCLGFLCALVFSMVAGSLSAYSQHDYQANLFIALSPVMAFFVYELGLILWLGTFRWRVERGGRTWRRYVVDLMTHVSHQCAIATTVVVAILAIPGFLTLPLPGLAAIGILILLMAFTWIRRGSLHARQNMVLRNITWREQFFMEPSTKMGFNMLGIICWTCMFVIANAGLSSYGL